MSKLNSQSSVEQPFCSKASGKKLSGKKTGFAFCGESKPLNSSKQRGNWGSLFLPKIILMSAMTGKADSRMASQKPVPSQN